MTYIYLHGFASSPASGKARFFERKFAEAGLGLLVPALDGGDFEHLTITRQLEVIRRVAGSGPATLIGSSMGGYLAALYASRHAEVEKVVLMAPAFAFARRWRNILGQEQMERWRETGSRIFYHYGYGGERNLFYTLIEDGLQYEDFPAIEQPALVLHGTRDDVVPVEASGQFVQNEPKRRLVLLDSGHELADVTDRLWAESAAFLEIENV